MEELQMVAARVTVEQLENIRGSLECYNPANSSVRTTIVDIEQWSGWDVLTEELAGGEQDIVIPQYGYVFLYC